MQQLHPNEKTVRLNTKMPETLRTALLAKTKAEGVTASALIRGWIEDYLGSMQEVYEFTDLEMEYYKNPGKGYYKMQKAGYTDKDIAAVGTRLRAAFPKKEVKV